MLIGNPEKALTRSSADCPSVHTTLTLTAWQRWKFSCLHFVYKNKGGMIDAYVRDVLPSDQRAQFAETLVTS